MLSLCSIFPVIDWGKLVTLSAVSSLSLTEANWLCSLSRASSRSLTEANCTLCLQHLPGHWLRQRGHSVCTISWSLTEANWTLCLDHFPGHRIRQTGHSVYSIFSVIDWGKLVSLSTTSSGSLTEANWSVCLQHLPGHWLRQTGHSVSSIFPVIDLKAYKMVIQHYLTKYNIFPVIDWGKLVSLSPASFRSLTEANWSLCLQHLSGHWLRQTGQSVSSIFPVIDLKAYTKVIQHYHTKCECIIETAQWHKATSAWSVPHQ